MIGEKRNLPKPAYLMLKGTALPWVSTATHLGHELAEWITMSKLSVLNLLKIS